VGGRKMLLERENGMEEKRKKGHAMKGHQKAMVPLQGKSQDGDHTRQ